MIELLRGLLPPARRACIAEIVDLAGPDATVVLASDHGFGPTRDVFHVNTWLEQQGYLAWADERRRGRRAHRRRLRRDDPARHRARLDADASPTRPRRAARGSTSSSRVPGQRRRRAAPSPRAAIAAELVARRCAASARPHDGRPLVAEVWTREEAFAGPVRARSAPICRSCSTDGGTISILPLATTRAPPRAAARPPPLGGHLHRRGPGHPRGRAASTRSRSSTSRRCSCTGSACRSPTDMAGRLPAELFEPDELERRPPRRAPARCRVAPDGRSRDAGSRPRRRGAGRRDGAAARARLRGVSDAIGADAEGRPRQRAQAPLPAGRRRARTLVMVHGLTGNLAVWHLQIVPALATASGS